MKYSKISISNAAAPTGEIGGTYSHSYQYDELNRLISASGKAKDKNYELLMRYDVMSNPLQKDSVSYEYNTPNHPNAVSCAGGKLFTYDANGNPISVEDTTANTLRVMQWDEENRLQSLGDDGYVSRYTYNHAGERVIKSHGPTTVAFVNGAPQGILWHDKDNWTMYVSPYMVVNSDRFTKHYYAGSQRIASKIGAGEFNNLYDASKACVTAGQKDYAERLNLITQSRNDYYAALGIPPGPPTAKGIYGEAEYSGKYGDYVIEPLGDYSAPTGWPMKPYKRPYGGTPGPPVMYEKPSDPEDEGAGYGYSNGMSQQERDVFYYHSDHLGSTSYITDKDGNATQFVSYKPYGEALVDEHATSYEMPWKFNGKELDSETGLYYYGARYYEPVLALWYGVDALTEKYPNMGGYVYCAGNPVKLVDVDGNEPTEEEAARMAAHVYGGEKDHILKGGWIVSNRKFDGVTLNDKNGLKSNIYERKVGDKTEYAYVLAGTDFDSWEDWQNNLQQPLGVSEQYNMAMNNAEKIAKELNVSDNTGNVLTFVGHSLGGGMAAACAYRTKGRAMTFNAAGVSCLTVNKFNAARIDAYVNLCDELNNNMPIYLRADGIPHLRINRASVLGHSIDNFYKPGIFESIYNAIGNYYMQLENKLESTFSPSNLLLGY